jgi:hypothetical protein
MKRHYAIFFILLLTTTVSAATERNWLAAGNSPASVAQYLAPVLSWVPYPAYSDRKGWDKLTGDRRAEIIARGERRLNYKWQVITATDYLEYERSGNRNVMQNPNSENSNALADLVMAELAEGKGRFMDQIINGVFYQCERTSWALSAHLPAQHSGRTLPEYADQIIDLGSGEMGAFLSWVYYFFHTDFDKVNPAISKRLYHEIESKILLPYRNEDRFWWMGFKPDADHIINNWNPWCNFNVLQCQLLLEKDPGQLSRDMYRTMLSVDKFINYVNGDGACEEGPSYWEHAAGKLYDYLEVLSMATNGHISLFDKELIRKMGEYISRSYVGNDWVVNFADASAKFSSDAGLIFRYGKAIKSAEMMGFGAYLIQQGHQAIDYGGDIFHTLESLRYDKELKSTPPALTAPGITEYPETQFYFLKNGQHYFLAALGGHNAESHNHNDVGSCSLYFDNIPVLIDAGVGTYVRQTFGPERYTIWTMRSLYHNLPEINGTEQHDGRQYRATRVQFDEKKKSLSIGIEKAYTDSAEINQWTRSYRLTDKGVEIADSFRLKAARKENRIHFMLWGKIDCSVPGLVAIEVQNKKLRLTYDAGQFTAALEPIPLTDSRLSNVWGATIYRLTLTAKGKTLSGIYRYFVGEAR